jgi:hypothetical protein
MDSKRVDSVPYQAKDIPMDVRRIDSRSLGGAHRQDVQRLLFKNDWKGDTALPNLPQPHIRGTDPKNPLPVDSETKNLPKGLVFFYEYWPKSKTVEAE